MENYKDEVEFTSPKHRNQVETVSLNTLLQNERLKIITDELVAGKSKLRIITEYSEKWNTKPKTIKALLNEAITQLHYLHSGNTIEEMRSEQVAKLEDLYNDATVSEKLKIIDLVSDTLGLYEQNLNVKTEDSIKINLGV